MSFIYALTLIFSGATGALTKDIADNNCLNMPHLDKGVLRLGFLGAVIVGSALGYFIDNSPITAFLAGYAGVEVIDRLLAKKI